MFSQPRATQSITRWLDLFVEDFRLLTTVYGFNEIPCARREEIEIYVFKSSSAERIFHHSVIFMMWSRDRPTQAPRTLQTIPVCRRCKRGSLFGNVWERVSGVQADALPSERYVLVLALLL